MANKDSFNIERWIEKSQLKIERRKDGMTDYRTHTARAVSDQQKADLLHNNPIFDFIGLDKEGRKNTFTFKELWKYWWKIDETDSKIIDVVDDAADLGSGYIYLGWKDEWRTINKPFYNKKTKRIDYVEDPVEWYCWPYSEYLPLENVFLDGDSVENSNELIIARIWEKEEWIKSFEHNKEYSFREEDITEYSEYITQFKDAPQLNKTKDTLILELSYYNKADDTYIVEVNGKEVMSSPIPHLHKDLPIAKYDNHKYRNRLIQMGNYEMLEESERYIDSVRSQSIDVTQANIGFTVVPKDANLKLRREWPFVFADVSEEDLSSIRYYGSNIQPSQLSVLESKGGDDVTLLSWVNYKNQTFEGASEAATKTNSRNDAQAKRTNLILKRNSFKFYNRLAKLRINDILLVASFGEKTIDIKWNTQLEDGSIKSIWQNAYWTFTIKPEMVKGKVNVILQTESLLWNSTEKELERFLSFFQVFGNVADNNGKKIINQEEAIRIVWAKYWIDVDSLLSGSIENKSGEELFEEMMAEEQWKNLNAQDSSNPNFIPWANRANDSGGINVIWWGNTKWMI